MIKLICVVKVVKVSCKHKGSRQFGCQCGAGSPHASFIIQSCNEKECIDKGLTLLNKEQQKTFICMLKQWGHIPLTEYKEIYELNEREMKILGEKNGMHS